MLGIRGAALRGAPSLLARQLQRPQLLARVPGGDDRDRDQQDRGERQADFRGHRAVTRDLLGDRQGPLLDAERPRAGHQAAEQGLPDQRVDQTEDDRVAG